MRAIIAAATVLLFALAGCTQEPGKEQDATPTTSPTDTAAPTNTTNETPPNTPPTASISADPVNGSAPLNVTFTLEGTDADEDELSWTADLDGDGTVDEEGTTLPAEVLFTYDEAGNYTALLTVTDGNGTANATATITVEAVAEAKEDLWVRWDAEGMCHAKGAEAVGPLWWHDRPAEGEPQGTGFADENGGGTWIYEESNGVEGLQVGGEGEAGDYVGCANPDTIIF